MSLKKQGDEQKQGLTRTKGQSGKGKSVEGLGQAATTDTTAVIRPPQNKPEEHSSLWAERGRTRGGLCVSVHPRHHARKKQPPLIVIKEGIFTSERVSAPHRLKKVCLQRPFYLIPLLLLHQCSTNFILSWDAVNSRIIILTNGPDRPSRRAGEEKKKMNCLSDWPELEQTFLPDPEKIICCKITVISPA